MKSVDYDYENAATCLEGHRVAPPSEDGYECVELSIQRTKAGSHPPASSLQVKLVCFMLMVLHTILLAVILFFVAFHYSHSRSVLLNMKAEELNGQVEEIWLLRQNQFFYFSTKEGSCKFAQEFCAKRNASLVSASGANKDFLMSKAASKNFWTMKSFGTEKSAVLHEDYSGWPMENDSDDEDGSPQACRCALFPKKRVQAVNGCEENNSWICEKRI
ncbi:uncharacterized protein LOC114647614 [Erpetoichthys calabaricus]|uniref:uncharacterized protein LOC114647614 n=1 Tax=Erpetoichthys calabaricus TaxID=27687 RepID=UPI002233E3F2|nr:uncharacterized protein LOC114647614 [Erpetoichthys calabaricus]